MFNVCFSAIYLAVTLALGTLSVICTILVVNVYFRKDEEEIPGWFRKFTLKVLVRIVCWKRHCCCATFNKHKVKPTDENEKPPPGEKMAIRDAISVSSSHTDENEAEDLTWQEIAQILDKLFFNINISIVVIFTFILWTIFIAHYATAV